uniref:Type IV pilin n=1 Tax=Archaeoglobus fulgidus TaxID=2234 RepID=A0A7J2TGF3_ARCFL
MLDLDQKCMQIRKVRGIKVRSSDGKAVSQIIGAALMVAITAIIAALALSAVLGFAEIKKMYLVAFTVEEVNESHIKVRYNGGPDHRYLSYCRGIIDGIDVGSINISIGSITEIEHGKSGAFDFAIACRFVDNSTWIVYSSRLHSRMPNP